MHLGQWLEIIVRNAHVSTAPVAWHTYGQISGENIQCKYLAKSFLIRKKAQTSKNVGTCHTTLWIIALSQE